MSYFQEDFDFCNSTVHELLLKIHVASVLVQSKEVRKNKFKLLTGQLDIM